MYVQTKKVVIIYIVTLITFASIINNLYRETQNTIPQISVVSSEELSYKISFAQSIFNDLSVDGAEADELSMYGASIYQIAQTSSAQLTNIVNSSNTVIIVGDSFNDYLNDLIIDNPERQFVLVENSLNYDFDNVYQINIDYESIYSAINRLSAHQKSVVVISSEYSEIAQGIYYQSEIATNGNVKLEIVNDTTNVAGLKTALNKDFKNGFTKVYSLNPYNNSTIIEVVNAYNQEVQSTIENQALSQASDVDESTVENEVVDVKDIVDTSAYIDLSYLTLSQTDYLSQDNNKYLSNYLYDASKQMKEVIDSTMKEEISHSDELISITNNN